MDITLQKTDEVNGKLTVKVVKADYDENVQKSLKKIKKQAKMPGFRPGMVPMGMIQKMYGLEVKAEEMQKVISESINNYIKDEKLDLVTSPLNIDDEKVDVEAADDFEMHFEVGLTPSFSIELSAKDKIPYYNIDVTDAQVEEQINAYRRRNGKFEEVDTFGAEDLLRGTLVELDEKGAEKADGLKIEDVSVMPKFFSNEDQKKLFEGAKKGDVVFNVSKAYDGKETEVAALLKVKKEDAGKYVNDFKYSITSISHMSLAEMNQDLFDAVFGKDAVKDEAEFRNRVKEDIEKVYAQDSDYKFILDIKDYCLKKAGDVKFPEEIMKHEMLLNAKDDKQKEEIEKNFAEIVKDREWALICSKLMEQLKVNVEDKHIKEAAMVVARSQFAQYGLTNVPDEYLEHYAEEMTKDDKQLQRLVSRAIDIELTKAIKATVKLQEKKISIEDFNAMFNA